MNDAVFKSHQLHISCALGLRYLRFTQPLNFLNSKVAGQIHVLIGKLVSPPSERYSSQVQRSAYLLQVIDPQHKIFTLPILYFWHLPFD